jgi:hypothetical protein
MTQRSRARIGWRTVRALWRCFSRIAGNGVRTILVESAHRFARDLIVQETGWKMLRERGIELIAADSPNAFLDDTPTAIFIRQVRHRGRDRRCRSRAIRGGIFSEGAPPAPYAFLSHQSDSVVAQLCTVKVRLTQRKPHDDFCGLLPIGRAPQIKLGNDAVESL